MSILWLIGDLYNTESYRPRPSGPIQLSNARQELYGLDF